MAIPEGNSGHLQLASHFDLRLHVTGCCCKTPGDTMCHLCASECAAIPEGISVHLQLHSGFSFSLNRTDLNLVSIFRYSTSTCVPVSVIIPEGISDGGQLQLDSDFGLALQDTHHEGALLPLPNQELPILEHPLRQAWPQQAQQMILQHNARYNMSSIHLDLDSADCEGASMP